MTIALENSKKHISLTEIDFPVFKLPSGRPVQEGNLLYYKSESYNKNTETYRERIKIIDDTSIPHPTLSRRRLKLLQEEVDLYPIHLAIYFLGDLIKLSLPNTWWIDSSGKWFEYKKSTRAKLRFYKLDKCFTTQGMGAVVQVHGLPQRFKTMFLPSQQDKWCGVLECDGLYIFYGFYKEQHKETWRLI